MSTMDNEELIADLTVIKSSSNKREVYERLVKLRRFVDRDEQFTRVCENGGVQIVVGLLPKKYYNIVDVALSILGNCCKQRACAKQVIRHHGLQYLRAIMVNWQQDSILCRAVRMLGNIAEFDDYAMEIFKYGFVPLVIKVLYASEDDDNNEDDDKIAHPKFPSKRISMGTQDMAVRTLRILCKNVSNRESIILGGGVRAVAMIMIQYTERWELETNDQIRTQLDKFLRNVLKCLVKMTTIIKCKEQLTEVYADGNGFKSLVSLIDLDPVMPIQCLTNLSNYAVSRSVIQNSNAVIKILNKIRTNDFRNLLNKTHSDGLLTALRLLSDHPMNRNEIRENNGLQVILELFDKCGTCGHKYEILRALKAFHNQEQCQRVLVENGVVRLMLDLLERYLVPHEHQHPPGTGATVDPWFPHQPNRADEEEEDDEDENDEAAMADDERFQTYPQYATLKRLFDYNDTSVYSGEPTKRRRYSQQSSADSDLFQREGASSPQPTFSFSPVSSPSCTPPRNCDGADEDDDDSVNYSPVCSDQEDPPAQEGNDDDETAVTMSTAEDGPEYRRSHRRCHPVACCALENNIVLLLVNELLNVVHMREAAPDLITRRAIRILLCLPDHPLACEMNQLLIKILSETENLVPLMKNRVVQLFLEEGTYRRHPDLCMVLANVANTHRGRALILDEVQSEHIDVHFLISIPYLIKKRNLANVLRFTGGLNVLIRHMSEDTELRPHIIVMLHLLAVSFEIRDPTLNDRAGSLSQPPSPTEEEMETAYCSPDAATVGGGGGASAQNNPSAAQVNFVLDDGSIVPADRDFLARSSAYFHAMLLGSFKESSEGTVQLRNVSSRSLRCLLGLMRESRDEPRPLRVPLRILLEVIELSDLYLLSELNEWLIMCVQCYALNSRTAPHIYAWSVHSGTNFLRIETVAFLLRRVMALDVRARTIQQICTYGLAHHVTTDIKLLFRNFLKE